MASLFSFILSEPFTAEDFLNKLFPNFWSFLINFLALIVLFVAVYFLAYKPLKKYIAARKDYIEHNLRDSERAKKINEQKAAESDQLILDAKKQANDIIAKAKSDATVSAEAIMASAEKDASARQKAADVAIKQEEEKSRRSLHEDVVNLAMDASKQVLGHEVNSEDNKRLIRDFTNKVDGDKKK